MRPKLFVSPSLGGMRLLLTVFLAPRLGYCLHQSTDVSPKVHSMYNVEHTLNEYLDFTIQKKKMALTRFTSRFIYLMSTRPAHSKDDLNTPLHSLATVRRLAEEWTALSGMAHENYGLSQLGLDSVRWPTSYHVSLAAYSVMRTQWTYGLDTRLLADGIISGNKVISNFTAADCFHVGRIYWEYSHVDEAMDWYEQAVYKVSRGDTSVPLQTLAQHLIPYLCYSDSNVNKLTTLIKLLEQSFGRQLKPTEEVWAECTRINENIHRAKPQGLLGNILGEEMLKQHQRACRGVAGPRDPALRCRYLHYDLPHLRLQPFKVEELHRDPPVLRFHEVVTDQEADQLILYVTKVKSMEFQADDRDGVTYYDNFRRTDGTFIEPGESAVNDQLCRRMEDMTQLSMKRAEETVLTRYGSGGEYLTHHDYMDDPKTPFYANRIAVLLFYLNDVEEGGYTILPNLNLNVKPIKNSAILWFNVLPSGEKDMRTEHSGCPVVRGTKWVLVKQITNEDQEFKKPCGLRENDSFTSYYIK